MADDHDDTQEPRVDKLALPGTVLGFIFFVLLFEHMKVMWKIYIIIENNLLLPKSIYSLF